MACAVGSLGREGVVATDAEDEVDGADGVAALEFAEASFVEGDGCGCAGIGFDGGGDDDGEAFDAEVESRGDGHACLGHAAGDDGAASLGDVWPGHPEGERVDGGSVLDGEVGEGAVGRGELLEDDGFEFGRGVEVVRVVGMAGDGVGVECVPEGVGVGAVGGLEEVGVWAPG